jgi:hypothetical protein
VRFQLNQQFGILFTIFVALGLLCVLFNLLYSVFEVAVGVEIEILPLLSG